MSESDPYVPDPYVPRNPGDPITAGDWNKMQDMAREHILTHDHSGGKQGVQITDNAIDKAELTLKSLTLEGGFIKGLNPLFNKAEAERDKEAVAILKNEDAGTFLIAGPRNEAPKSFCIYWNTGNSETPYMRFDSNQLAQMGTTITPLNDEGKIIKEP